MVTFKNRFAPIQDILLVFAACVVPVYSWSIFIFLYRLPGWLIYLSIWDIIGIAAYTLTFDFLESGIILFFVVVLGAILPAELLRHRFATQGSVLVLAASIFFAVAQYNIEWHFVVWRSKEVLLWVEGLLISIVVSYTLIYRCERIEETVHSFVERLTVFFYIYIPLSLVGVVIIIMRNI